MGVSKPLPASGEHQNWDDYIHGLVSLGASNEMPAKRFQELVAKWKEATRFLSNTNEICTHTAYQQIIGMGPLALPHIFKEMGDEPGHWFWALKAISGADPVPEIDRGRIEKMTQQW